MLFVYFGRTPLKNIEDLKARTIASVFAYKTIDLDDNASAKVQELSKELLKKIEANRK